ncbi:hypothetical protein HMPREF9372_3524 [Sporosarcina newyorkensis 2681]|uniref:Uncharacterized protein n=1 Tax=Sporosarcina newyorkensis 2681 TaxID=1027292 RepID=F9DXJ3_9BACL|nr:hypothetical protein [Sporosarcina newyorkensis]EGQ20617.1 hypothetical protein HMPREF9372_3524 [Sporosarcina newyorkensis 2681]
MKLVNVRKGQFVYYQNKLHKVYSVKAFFRKSIHLIRLEDYKQQLATAREIDYYKPKHLDSFVLNKERYTLDKNVKAKVGDFILVINPKPDTLDLHHLNSIETVSKVENNGVISNQSNGIRHDEYWVMVPGLIEGANKIDLQNPSTITTVEQEPPLVDADLPPAYVPRIGDIFQKNSSQPALQSMVVAIQGKKIFLGGHPAVSVNELTDSEKWTYVYNIQE